MTMPAICLAGIRLSHLNEVGESFLHNNLCFFVKNTNLFADIDKFDYLCRLNID